MADMGRPSKYSEEINQMAKDYIDNYKDHDHPLPSVVGMAVVLNIAKSTLYKWAEEGKGNISDTLDKCNQSQELTLLHKGLTNDFSATIVKLALANHGHREATSTEVSGPGGGPIQTGIFEFVPVDENS